ncbi:MAG: hypothetical protein Q3966_04125 [Neisseria sp.]|nr:hypothetical protein [Neisseria sp.]
MPRFTSLLCLAALAAFPARAATYICKVDGKAAYSSIKVNSSCKESQMDGISDKSPEQAASTADGGYDAISEIWQKEIYGSYDDITILPRATESVTNSAAPPRLEIKLRNQTRQAAGGSIRPAQPAPIRTAAPLYVPPAKPQLTRAQILQKEISNERAALVRTKSQLETAKKKGGSIIELQQAVRDREANIRAIEREIGR